MIKKKITLITVNYKNSSDTIRFINSLTILDGFSECQVVVIDNASSAKTKEELKILEQYYDNIIVIYSYENLYYWGAADYVIKKLYSNMDMTDWIIVCNNDIVIEQKNFFSKLLSIDHNNYGVIAPCIISDITQKNQNPFLNKRITTLRVLIWKIYYLHYYIAQSMLFLRKLRNMCINNSTKKKKFQQNEIDGLEIYAPHGAFIVFSKQYFEKGGILDTNFRLYGEELTTAEIVRRLGLTVLHYPSIQVIHKEHSTTGMSFSKSTYKMQKEAFTYFLKLYY